MKFSEYKSKEFMMISMEVSEIIENSFSDIHMLSVWEIFEEDYSNFEICLADDLIEIKNSLNRD
jgi:hypothetical protein